MLEMLNMESICCTVGFSEKIIAVFCLKKSQTDTEIDKNPIIFQFSKKLCILFQISDGICELQR